MENKKVYERVETPELKKRKRRGESVDRHNVLLDAIQRVEEEKIQKEEMEKRLVE